MAPTEGKFARPDWQWGCHCGTPRACKAPTLWED